MSLAHSSNIVTNGLVFYYDSNNTKKSWKGKPTTNTCSFGNYSYTSGNCTVTRNTTHPTNSPPPITGYEIAKLKSNDGNDCQTILYTAGVDQVNGGVYTHSAYIYLESGTYVKVGQHWHPWDYGVPNYIPKGVWTRVSYTVTNYQNNNGSVACSYNTDGTIYITATQYEQGSFATPFVGGTRSSSQAIIDLTGTNAITANSLTYNSNGTFNFNGTGDYITVGALPGSFSSFTVLLWINSSSVQNYRNPIDCNYNYNANSGNIGPRLEQNSSGNLVWALSGNTTTNSSADSYIVIPSNMQPNTWYCVGISRNGSTVSTYLNGSVVSYSATNPNSFVNVFNNVVIGKGFSLGGAERIYSGQVPIVQIYNRELSTAEVKQNFDAQRDIYGV